MRVGDAGAEDGAGANSASDAESREPRQIGDSLAKAALDSIRARVGSAHGGDVEAFLHAVFDGEQSGIREVEAGHVSDSWADGPENLEGVGPEPVLRDEASRDGQSAWMDGDEEASASP